MIHGLPHTQRSDEARSHRGWKDSGLDLSGNDCTMIEIDGITQMGKVVGCHKR